VAEPQTNARQSLGSNFKQLNKGFSLTASWGLARSLLMYYAIPGRARGWRKLYSQFVSPDDLCFDIGAHVGNRTGALLALGARVVALEPQPLFASVLARLYRGNPNFKIFPKAVGAKVESHQMLISSGAPTVSTLSSKWADRVSETESFAKVKWDSKLEVDVTTLDTLIAEYGLPVFCKIDVEGYELEVVLGLSQPIRTLSFEYVPAVMQIALSCVDRLMKLDDYRFNLIRSEYPKFDLPNWVDSKSIKTELEIIDKDARAGEIYARLAAG
jgi:FkbM family methyltransferase